MQEKETITNKESEKEQQNEICNEEKPQKIQINKKVIIKCKDYEQLQESLDLMKSNENTLNKFIGQKPFIAPEILVKQFEKINSFYENSDKEGQQKPLSSNYGKNIRLPSGIVQISTIINKENKKGSYEPDYSGMNPKV